MKNSRPRKRFVRTGNAQKKRNRQVRKGMRTIQGLVAQIALQYVKGGGNG